MTFLQHFNNLLGTLLQLFRLLPADKSLPADHALIFNEIGITLSGRKQYGGGDNSTLPGGSLPRRSQRPGRKNSLSQRPCVRDQGEPYSNCGFRLWSIINSLERDGLRQAELCPRHTMKMKSSGLAKTILQGTVKGKRKRGRQKKRWEDNIKEWTGMDFASLTRAAENRSRWKGIVANSSVVPRRPSKVMG